MKRIGLLLISVGFLAGTLSAIVDIEHVQWGYFSVALAFGVAGVFVARSGHHQMHKSEEKLNENIRTVEISLANIVHNINTLNSEKQSINTYDVRFRIDELFVDDLAGFVAARESIAHRYGLTAYGQVMSSFAAGERYLNRVWSASADGYIDEVNTYLDKAQEQFVESLEKIRQYEKSQLEDVRELQVLVTSEWAKIGLFSALAGLLLFVLLPMLVLAGFSGSAILYLALLPSLAMLVALVSTIVGIVEIIARRPDMKGWGHVVKSLVIVMIYCGAITFTLVWSTRERQKMEMREAVESGSIEEVARLLERKPEMVNLRYHRELTPLARVINTTGDMEMIEFLISKGANINADCGIGDTPLHWTVMNACLQDSDEGSGFETVSDSIDFKAIIEYLLQNGADVNRRNDRGETPLDTAMKFDCNDVTELLRKHGGSE